MSHYTVDQIQRLSEIFRSENLHPGFLYLDGLDDRELRGSLSIYSTLSKKVGSNFNIILADGGRQMSEGKDNYGWIKKVMYDLPLEDMPLYINEYVLGIIARWRIEISQ